MKATNTEKPAVVSAEPDERRSDPKASPVQAQAYDANNPVIERALRRLRESQELVTHTAHHTHHSSHSTHSKGTW